LSAPMHNDLDAALAALREDRQKIEEAIDRVNEVAETVTSNDRMVRATVNAQGRLTGLELNGRRWRDLASKELCTKIVEAVREAQTSAAARTVELMAGLMPPGLEPMLAGSGPDFESILGEMLENFGEGSHGRAS
jgi:hypothetical protein